MTQLTDSSVHLLRDPAEYHCPSAREADAPPIQMRNLSPQQVTAMDGTLQRMLRHRGLSREDAEDLAQETLLRGLSSAVHTSLPAWSRAVASHAGTTLRRRKHREELTFGKRSGLDPDLFPCDPWQASDVEELREAIRSAVQKLSLRVRGIVELRLAGRTFGEIGELLELSVRQVSSRFDEARARLRELLRDIVVG